MKTEEKKVNENAQITPYEAMELVDEEQMVNEIEGSTNPVDLEAFVYSFPDRTTGKEITGLSWRGTKAVWWSFNKKGLTNLTITDKVIITPFEGGVDVAVYAFDEKRKIGAWGMARAYNVMQTKTGAVQDRFTSAKAMSKAQRNALNQLFPSELVARMIKTWIKEGKVKSLAPTSQYAQSGQYAPTNPNGKASVKQVNYINLLCSQKGVDREHLKEEIGVESMNDLTMQQAKAVIDGLLKRPTL